MPNEILYLPDEVLVAGSWLSGCHVCFDTQSEYIHAEFPEEIKKLSLGINALELLTVVIEAKVWGKKWCGMRVVFRCDNETSVMVLNTGRAYNSFVLECFREMGFGADKWEIAMKGVHIPGVGNRIPDALSYWEIGK